MTVLARTRKTCGAWTAAADRGAARRRRVIPAANAIGLHASAAREPDLEPLRGAAVSLRAGGDRLPPRLPAGGGPAPPPISLALALAGFPADTVTVEEP